MRDLRDADARELEIEKIAGCALENGQRQSRWASREVDCPVSHSESAGEPADAYQADDGELERHAMWLPGRLRHTSRTSRRAKSVSIPG